MTFNLDLGRQTGWMKYEKVTILVSTTAMSKYAVIPFAVICDASFSWHK
jgi:hypothetical protein